MSENKDEKELVNVKIPFISEEILMSSKDYVNIIKFLLFIVGYLVTSFIHLMNMMGEVSGDFYSFMIGDSLIKSIPEGFIVGLVFTFFKKK